MDSVALHLVVEGSTRDTKNPAGPGSVVAGGLKGLDDQLTFHFFEGHADMNSHFDISIAVLPDPLREMFDIEDIAGAGDDSPLDDVF